jgi:hypothetical protein
MSISRLLVSAVVAFAATAASAQTASTKLPDYAKTPQELSAVAPTGGAGGSGNAAVQVVTILGDASKPGVYAQLLKVGPNAQIPAHHHAGDRVGTVPVGSVYTEPAGAPHFAMTGNEPVIVLLTGVGPTDTVYENPSDDPTKKH